MARSGLVRPLQIGNARSGVVPSPKNPADQPEFSRCPVCHLETQRLEQIERRLAVLEGRRNSGWLLHLIWRATQGRVFTVHELLDHCRADRDLADALDGLSPHRLGVRLGKIAKAAHGGLRLQHAKREGGGVIWCVVQVDAELHEASYIPGESGS